MRMMLTPTRSSRGVTEAAIQRGVASYLRRLAQLSGAFTFTHPANEGKRSPMQGAILKAAGMQTGEPDIILFLRGGSAAFIELKNGQGHVSIAQRQRHEVLRGLGFDVLRHRMRARAMRMRERQAASVLLPVAVFSWFEKQDPVCEAVRGKSV